MTSISKERRRRRKNGPMVDSCARLQPGGAKHSKMIQGTVVSLIRIPGSHGPDVPETREANVKCTDKTEGKLDVRGHRHIRRQPVSVTGYPRWLKKI
ncbi:hypothetical protein Prudu_007854 [Prunus dulcis]|uniref:Uncharacterized protein n=1 Tax=Prunus dulcis TaxID=3755 RepID=A0A4Y1R320_PRUDU|nr:hypothetical protein Prudu_007854 [Prunus dulcis]